jgi:hypothetical protein
MYLLSVLLQLVITYVVEIYVAVMTKDMILSIRTQKIMHVYKVLLLILLK